MAIFFHDGPKIFIWFLIGFSCITVAVGFRNFKNYKRDGLQIDHLGFGDRFDKAPITWDEVEEIEFTANGYPGMPFWMDDRTIGIRLKTRRRKHRFFSGGYDYCIGNDYEIRIDDMMDKLQARLTQYRESKKSVAKPEASV